MEKDAIRNNLLFPCFSVSPRFGEFMPSAGRLGFLTNKILAFLTFLAKILANILGKVHKILEDFSRSWKKKSKKILGVLGNKNKNIQDIGKRNKKILHKINARSIDIL